MISAPVLRQTHGAVGAVSSFTFSPASNFTPGMRAIYFFGNSGSTKSVSSMSDTAGNTWAVDHVFLPASAGVSVASCVVGTLTTSTVITVHLSIASNNGNAGALVEVGGLMVSAALDQSADGSAATNMPSVGPTGTLAQAQEIALAWFFTSSGARTFASGAAWTNTPLGVTGQGLEYQIVNAIGPLTADAVWGGGGAVNVYQTLLTYRGLPSTDSLVAHPVGRLNR